MSILEKLTLNIKEKQLQELISNDLEDELKIWTGLKTIITVNPYTVMGLLAVEKLIAHQQMVGSSNIYGGQSDYNTLVQEISHLGLFENLQYDIPNIQVATAAPAADGNTVASGQIETAVGLNIDSKEDVAEVKDSKLASIDAPTSETDSPTKIPKAQQNYTIMDDLILLLWKITDKNEELCLQVLKLLLTIVTSDKTEIHQYSLILAFKICFNIFSWFDLKSTNNNTARASLTQMINMIFAKLERFSTAFDPNVDLTGHLVIPDVGLKTMPSDARLEQSKTLIVLRQDVLMTLRFLIIHAGSTTSEKVF